MPTLQEITLAHSQRLSELYRNRDIRLAEAQSLRDLQLRSLPAAARTYQKYDDEVAVARTELTAIAAATKQAETEAFSRFRRELESVKT